MTFTVELPNDLATQLAERADANEFAVAAIRTALNAPPDEDEDTLAAIGRGIADMQVGRTVTLDQARNAVRAALAEEFPAPPAAAI